MATEGKAIIFIHPKAFWQIVDLLYGPEERPSRVRL